MKPSGSNIKNRFSRFRPGLPSSEHVDHDEKISGPNIDPSKGIQIIHTESEDEISNENETTTIIPLKTDKTSVKTTTIIPLKTEKKSVVEKESTFKSKFSKRKSSLFSRNRNKVFKKVKETTTTSSILVPEITTQAVSQNKTTEKPVEKTSKTLSNIFANAKRPKFSSKFSKQFSQKRSSLFRPRPSVEKNSTENVKPNISLDSDSVTTPQPLSTTLTQTQITITSAQPNSSSPKPSPPKSSSSNILSSPARKRFQFRSGSKKSPLNSLFNRRNKHKKSQILSRLTTTTPPSEETTLTSAQEEKVESRTTTQATTGRAYA